MQIIFDKIHIENNYSSIVINIPKDALSNVKSNRLRIISLGNKMEKINIPIIACASGTIDGHGLELLMHADVRFVDKEAFIPVLFSHNKKLFPDTSNRKHKMYVNPCKDMKFVIPVNKPTSYGLDLAETFSMAPIEMLKIIKEKFKLAKRNFF